MTSVMSSIFSRKKTLEQVEIALLQKICKESNDALPEPERVPITVPSTLQTLKANLLDILDRLATHAFEEQYHYFYLKDDTIPTERARDTVLISSSEASFDRDDPDASIDSFVDTVLRNNGILPDQARVDLHQQAESLLSPNHPRDNQWHSIPLTKAYEIGTKYENAIRMDGTFIYVNGILTEQAITATCNILYYVGVSYYVYSEAEKARQTLWKSIVQNANQMLTNQIDLHDPPTMPELSSIMIRLRDDIFSKDFDYSYYEQPHDATGFVSRASHLFALYDRNDSTFEKELHGIIDPMGIPPLMKEAIFSSISGQLESEIQLQPQSSVFWTNYKIDKTHFAPTANSSNIDENSMVIICNASSTERPDVSMCFLFYAVVLYEINPSHDNLERQLLDEMFASANSLLSRPTDPPQSPTRDDIDRILRTLCDQEFMKEFGFTYQGTDSQPLDRATDNDPIYANKTSFKSEKVGPDSADTFVGSIMKSWKSLPEYIATAIHGDLTKEINNAFQTQTPRNTWRIRAIPDYQRYQFEDPDHSPLGTKALLIFCNGTASTPAGDHAFTLNWTNVYYIGIYYEILQGGFLD